MATGLVAAGDVFTQLWGKTERILVVLPKKGRQRKTHFVRLHSPVHGGDSNYLFDYEGWWRQGFTYRGRIPAGWLEEMVRRPEPPQLPHIQQRFNDNPEDARFTIDPPSYDEL